MKHPYDPASCFTREEAAACVRDGVLTVPENKTTLCADFAFFVVREDLPRVHTLRIPASVKRIESMRGDCSMGPYGYKNNPFSKISVAEENPYYASRDGVLFTKDLDTLLCYPCGRPGSDYLVPDEVLAIGTEAFLNVEHLERIWFPKPVRIEEMAFEACAGLDFPEIVRVYETGPNSYLLTVRDQGFYPKASGDGMSCYTYHTSADLWDEAIGKATEDDLKRGNPITGHSEKVRVMRRFARAFEELGCSDPDDAFVSDLLQFVHSFYADWD